MPFETVQYHDLGLVVHEGHGPITYEDIQQQMIKCFGAQGWNVHSLWDLRDASLQPLTGAQVRALADQAVAYARLGSGKKNGWVAVRPEDFGLCRMSQALAGNQGLDLAVFSDFDQALAWIRGDSG
ncbi:MAG TPA: hypothetical protein PKC67_14745 [Kiritimatiellia bacterium]|nr:hypothetical protein [Kiritimatiellia bacterium]HMP35592.1 hypothetical protein [Kiritimatiellia bacterium]